MRRNTQIAHKRRGGFTLIEIMIAVTLVGLLASVAIPQFIKMRNRARATLIANDMRIFTEAIDSYVFEAGGFPVYAAGTIAPELETWVKLETWNQAAGFTTGAWEYFNPNAAYTPEIVLDTPGGTNSNVFQVVDEMLDDGVATTGTIVFEDEYVLYQFSE